MRWPTGSILPLVLLAGMSLTPHAAARPRHAPLTPAGVRDAVRREGATRVVDRLAANNLWFDVVEAKIDAAAPGWIELAPLLAPGTDAATAEGLGLSLAGALPHAPDRVLAVLDLTGASPVLRPATVCSAGFIEVPAAEIAAYRSRTLVAVRRVRNAALARARAACIASLTRG